MHAEKALVGDSNLQGVLRTLSSWITNVQGSLVCAACLLDVTSWLP